MDHSGFPPRGKAIVLSLTLFLLLIIAQASRLPVCSQGTCGDGVCDAGETPPTCPQDCGILLIDEDFEDDQAQDWSFDPSEWDIVVDGGSQVWNTTQQGFASTGSFSWRDYVWFLRARRLNSDANLFFRTAWPNDYALRLEVGRVVLWTSEDADTPDLEDAQVLLEEIRSKITFESIQEVRYGGCERVTCQPTPQHGGNHRMGCLSGAPGSPS